MRHYFGFKRRLSGKQAFEAGNHVLVGFSILSPVNDLITFAPEGQVGADFDPIRHDTGGVVDNTGYTEGDACRGFLELPALEARFPQFHRDVLRDLIDQFLVKGGLSIPFGC